MQVMHPHWPKVFAIAGVVWLFAGATLSRVAAQSPIDPIAYGKCFADSNCGRIDCGGSTCNCCWRRETGSGTVYYECVDGSCVVIG